VKRERAGSSPLQTSEEADRLGTGTGIRRSLGRSARGTGRGSTRVRERGRRLRGEGVEAFCLLPVSCFCCGLLGVGTSRSETFIAQTISSVDPGGPDISRTPIPSATFSIRVSNESVWKSQPQNKKLSHHVLPRKYPAHSSLLCFILLYTDPRAVERSISDPVLASILLRPKYAHILETKTSLRCRRHLFRPIWLHNLCPR
jgi:hypothetical protein